jgi:hypothetical protein
MNTSPITKFKAKKINNQSGKLRAAFNNRKAGV